METTVRPKLTGQELENFDSAKERYEVALDNRQSEVAPSCPSCGVSMVRRSGRYGEFWGCSRYPLCKGTVNIRWAK